MNASKQPTMLYSRHSQVSLSEEAVAEAEANVKLTADYFAAGMVGVSDLLQAQTALQQARDNLTDTSIAYKIKFLNYRQLTQP